MFPHVEGGFGSSEWELLQETNQSSSRWLIPTRTAGGPQTNRAGTLYLSSAGDNLTEVQLILLTLAQFQGHFTTFTLKLWNQPHMLYPHCVFSTVSAIQIAHQCVCSHLLILPDISRKNNNASDEILFLHASQRRMSTVEISRHNCVGEIVWNLSVSEP